MPNASIGGLASGLDTAGIIEQLMKLEATPQTRLRSRVSNEQLQLNSLQTLNSRLAGLASRAAELAKAEGWSPLDATSSSSHVTVTTGDGASPTSLSLTVEQTALSHQLGFTAAAALDDVVTAGSTQVRLDRLDGTTVDLETGDGTLQGLVDAINDPDNATGLRASAVRVGEGQYRLLVESTTTGVASDFTLTNLDGTSFLGGATVRGGRDARIALGAGITVTSTTNTFTDVLPGLSLTVSAGTPAGTTSDVTVAPGTAGLATRVQSFVEAVNATLTEIDSLTAYNPTTKASGMLAGDPVVRSLRTQLLDAVYPGDGSSLAGFGVQVDRTGKLTFDKTMFTEAYSADPEAVTAGFTAGVTAGFAARVRDTAEAASDKTTGTITAAITGRTSGIRSLNASIEQWDVRLELRRTALTRQFTALETALSRMNSQSSWLAGQIGTLPTSSGS